MKPLTLKQDPNYTIKRWKNSEWVKAMHNKEMLGLCADLETAYQIIYTHIKESGKPCVFLTEHEFKGW